MVREIVRDMFFLGRVSRPASEEDIPAARDLLDTLKANAGRCVGMAANMIGVDRRIIVFDSGAGCVLMFNPRIIKRAGEYTAEEGCLSLDGVRTAKRWRSVKVEWQDENFRTRIKTFEGLTAQIIQHEIDHCDGILI